MPRTRRDFISVLGTLGLGATIGGVGRTALAAMASVPPNATPKTPKLDVSNPASFRILQVTDIHLFKGGLWLDHSLIDAIGTMVERFKPDIIVNTGDFWVTKSGTGWFDTCQRACRVFAEFKTPWAFAWGNHDEAADYNRVHALLETAPYLLYSGAADGNYRVEVQAKSTGNPLWNLILLNDSRGGFRPEQINWFKAEAGRIKQATPAAPPAFLFFHIPLPQYDDLATSGKAIGVKFESVCHENGSREAFSAFRDAGFVKAMFCGHDHVNDYHGIVDGIRLQYGRASGDSYGKEKVPKGGTLITVDATKQSFDVRSVLLDGSSVTYNTLTT